MNIKKFFFILGLLAPIAAFCQPQIQSPYSRIGLGSFQSSEVLSSQSLGGLSAIYHDRNNLNPMNPASFAFLGATSFDIGISAKNYTIKSKTDQVNNWSGALDNINLGISLVNDYNRELEGRKSDWRFGMGLGLSPYTKVGYDVESTTTKDDLTVNYKFTGEGGSYQINWSNAAKYKNLAFGANLGFLLGKVSETQYNQFSDTIFHYYNNEYITDYSYKGTNLKLGVIWDYYFKDNTKDNGKRGDFLTIGGYIQPGFDLKTTVNEQINRISNVYYSKDSIFYADEALYTSKHPMLYALGLGYSFEGLYRVGLNYEGANWSDFNRGFRQDKMGTANKISLGYEKLPNLKAYDSYWKKMAFRAGAFYSKDPRYVNDEQIRRFGITIGGGFPVIIPRQDISFINLGLEIGKDGVSSDLDQTYVKISMSFSLTDKSWFFKQKYY